MYHSITIGNLINTYPDPRYPLEPGHDYYYTEIAGKNTWTDWGLVPTSRPLINPPSANKSSIEIPGRNGTIDTSMLLTGRMTYKNRTGSWEFIVENRNIDVSPHKRSLRPDDWSTVYSTIMAYLHGKRGCCVLEDDPGYFYQGMFSVNSWKSDKVYSTIVIDYDLEPFKYTVQASDEPWLWDPFNFEMDYIRELGYWDISTGDWRNIVEVNGSTTLTIPWFNAPGNFMITWNGINGAAVSPMTLTINGSRVVTINPSPQINYVNNIYLDQVNPNSFVFNTHENSEHGFISVRYRAGEF